MRNNEFPPVDVPLAVNGSVRPAASHTRSKPSVPSTWPGVPPDAASFPLVTPPSAISSGEEAVPSPVRVSSWATEVRPPEPSARSSSLNAISKVEASLERLATPDPTAMIRPSPAITFTSRRRFVVLIPGSRSASLS